MKCDKFGICGSCVYDLPYKEQLNLKKERISAEFAPFYTGEIEVFASKESAFRSRAEFGIFHEGEKLHFSMRGRDKERVFVQNCSIVDEKIQSFMDRVLPILRGDEVLKFRLFGAEFIATKNDFLCVLLYHRNVEEIEPNLANLARNLGLNLIARSRGKKLIFGRENLEDEFEIEGQAYRYTFEATAFSQPNRGVNEKMISWVLGAVGDEKSARKDLLEMYCGHGNFTIPLSAKFRQILANEISKNSRKNALLNAQKNGAKNIKFVRLSADELMSAFGGEREFTRLEGVDLQGYEISHILVDPPRAGLEASVLNFIKDYKNIIYISCNPQSLKQNLSYLCKTHKVEKFAIFDQFAHTNHVECGVILKALV